MWTFALVFALFVACRQTSALFVPNITSAAADLAVAQKAYVDVSQIRNAELKFFNNGTYSFEVEMPCGVLNNRVLAVEQQSRLKLVDPTTSASHTGGGFRQREILFNSLPAAAAIGAASASLQLSRELQKEQQLHERLLMDNKRIAEQIQQPVRFTEREQKQQVAAAADSSSASQPVTPVIPLMPLLEKDAHSAQRCKCSCKDEQSGQVLDNVRITVAFPKPQQLPAASDLTVVTTTISPAAEELQQKLYQQQRRFVEVAQRKKRHAVSVAANIAKSRQRRAKNPMCLYVEEGKWPNSQDGFIKSLAPSRQSPALAADSQLELCQLHFALQQEGKKTESFTIDCRGTARCEQGAVEPVCLGGGHSVSTFQVANGELVLSIVPQPYMT